MSFRSLLVHDITVLTPGTTTDGYGQESEDWTAATESTTHAWISQRTRSENNDHRNAELSGWVAYLPDGTQIAARDRVRWGTTTFDVVGPPLPAWTPRGEHHLEVDLEVREG